MDAVRHFAKRIADRRAACTRRRDAGLERVGRKLGLVEVLAAFDGSGVGAHEAVTGNAEAIVLEILDDVIEANIAEDEAAPVGAAVFDAVAERMRALDCDAGLGLASQRATSNPIADAAKRADLQATYLLARDLGEAARDVAALLREAPGRDRLMVGEFLAIYSGLVAA